VAEIFVDRIPPLESFKSLEPVGGLFFAVAEKDKQAAIL